MHSTLEIPDPLGASAEPLRALLTRLPGVEALLVLAHGAGAGMNHAFMERIAVKLGNLGVATLRYEFPYTTAGRRSPDPPKRLVEAVRRAVEFAKDEYPDLSLFAGGKSLGGRMTSTAVSQGLTGVKGLVFFGFPLHAPGRDGSERARHLADVPVPMLFLQGTRDKLAEIGRMRVLVDELRGADRAGRADITLVELDDADHSFHVPRRTGLTDADVLASLATTAAAWIRDRV
jgi:hypothetical protein